MIQKLMAAFIGLMGVFAAWSTVLVYQDTHQYMSRGVIGSAVFALVMLMFGVAGLMPSGGHH